MPEGFTPPIVVRIIGDSKELTASMAKAGGEVEGFSKKSGGSLARLQSVGKAALLGIGTAAVGLGAEAVHLGDKWETAHAAMQAAITKTGAKLSQFQAPINAVQNKMQSLGFTYADTDSGLQSLVQATGSTQKSLSLMGLTADVARVKQISLAQAGVLVAKASEGQGRALKALGINVNTATGGARALITTQRSLASAQLSAKQALDNYNRAGGKTVANHQAMVSANLALKHAQETYNDTVKAGAGDIGLLTKSIGGQAQAYAGTFAGKMQVLKTRTEDLGAKIGVALIPKLEALVNWTMDVVNWFGKHSTVAKVLAGVIGGALAAAIAVYVAGLISAAAQSVASFAKMLASGATWVAEQSGYFITVAAEAVSSFIAMSTAALSWAAEMLVAGAEALLPFLPIILAVAAVGIAAYELYKHWDTVWGFVKRIANDAWSFLRPILTAIVKVGLWPIRMELQIAQQVWSTVWSAVKTAVNGAWNFLQPIFSDIVKIGILVIKREIQGLKNIWHDAWHGIKTVVQDVWSFIKPIFDAIEKGAKTIAGALGHVTGLLSHIPGGGLIKKIFGQGGVMPESGLAIVGDQGPEIVQLPGGARVMSNPDSLSFLQNMAGQPGGGGFSPMTDAVTGAARKAHAKAAKMRIVNPSGPIEGLPFTAAQLEKFAKSLADAISQGIAAKLVRERRAAGLVGNYVAPPTPAYSSAAGSYLAARTGVTHMQPIQTQVMLDGQVLLTHLQTHAQQYYRSNGRGPFDPSMSV